MKKLSLRWLVLTMVFFSNCETSTHPDSEDTQDSGIDSGSDTDTNSDTETETDTGSDTETDTDSSTGTDDCVPTEPSPEMSCDMIDNDCNGIVDDVDQDVDGICDCLNIGILGDTGYAPTSDFEAWLVSNGTSVTRTLLASNPDVVDSTLLSGYHVLLIDRVERGLSAAEAQAVEDFVKIDGRGVITLIGYNFDSGNPAPERDRANTVLAPFGLEYQGPYLHEAAGVTPYFVSGHPVSDGVSDVNYHGGIAPADVGGQGTTDIFATVPTGLAGLAHQTDTGGRVIVWGDEWITFDSDWAGFADVGLFWAKMLSWVKPTDFCTVPIDID